MGIIPVLHQLALNSHVWHIRAASQLIALMGATYIVSPSLKIIFTGKQHA
jgi:hypothetical protein